MKLTRFTLSAAVFFAASVAARAQGSDDCATPTPISGIGQFTYDNSLATTGTTGQNDALCLDGSNQTGIDNDLWWIWTSPSTGSVIVQTCNQTTTDTKIAAWPGGGCPVDGTALACNDDLCGGTESLIEFPVVGGQSYLLQMGNWPSEMGGPSGFRVIVTDTAGTPICFGDGTGLGCPCFNDGGPGQGCANGTGAGGLLTATGTPSVSNDTLTLSADGVINNNGLFFQGNNTIGGGTGSSFGDGIRCCGGGVVRLQVVNPPGSTSPATATMTETATTNGPNGTITAGTKKCYQFWYRDPATSPCGAQFNLTNAVTVTWQP